MQRFCHSSSKQSTWRALVGVLCIALVFMGATIQVSHAHADGRVHSDCSFCHAARIVVHAAAPPVLPHPLRPVVGTITVLETVLPQRFSAFCLSNRPPPAGTAVS